MENQHLPPLPPIPAILAKRIASGEWQHPGDETLQRLIPFLTDPLDFLSDINRIYRESSGMQKHDFSVLSIFPGSNPRSTELPFLNCDKALYIAVNRNIGDDVAIALDFRTSTSDPRIAASYWENNSRCIWREVAPTLSQFLDMLDAVR